MAKDLAVAPVERIPAIRPDYLLVADSIPALIGVIAPDGAVEGVNRSVLDYFGATVNLTLRLARRHRALEHRGTRRLPLRSRPRRALTRPSPAP